MQPPVAASEADLGAYLEILCGALCDATLRNRSVRLTLQTDPCPLDADRCWRVWLICAELTTNALRHGVKGDPGTITLNVSTARGRVYCVVIDSGRTAERRPQGLGSHVVASLARQFGGRVEWTFEAIGTTVLTAFPLVLASATPN